MRYFVIETPDPGGDFAPDPVGDVAIFCVARKFRYCQISVEDLEEGIDTFDPDKSINAR